MNKIIILPLTVICGVLLSGCVAPASVVRTGTQKMMPVPVTVEALPITADLAVSETKVRAEASGLAVDAALLGKEAVMKALGQDPPNIDGADVLVGLEVFTEQSDRNMRVVVTGYPAWYTNFRTVQPAGDPAWLVIPGTPGGAAAPSGPPRPSGPLLGLGLSHPTPAVTRTREPGKVKMYVTPRWNMAAAFAGYGAWAFNAEIGAVWPTGFFMGADWGFGFGESGREEKFHMGGGYSVGNEYDVGNGLKVGGGGSLGFWYSDVSEYDYYSYDTHDERAAFLGYFVTARWNNVELMYRGLIGDGYINQLTLGYRIVF